MSDVQLLDIGEIDQEVFSRWDITGHQVNRHLLSEALTGTDDVVLDHLTFPPGFIDHMHRHPHADMVIIPLSAVDSQVLHFFAGVGSVDDIGYEAHPGQGVAIGSVGRRGSSACG
jgi:hypothetical protein